MLACALQWTLADGEWPLTTQAVALRVCRRNGRTPMNKIEQIKAEKDGLDVKEDLYRYAQLGWEAIPEGDLERLKWCGVFFRKRTPGFFMMRIRMTNGIAT